MHIIDNRADLTAQVQGWRSAGERIAFVPTMGALHDGHLSLVDLAKTHGQRVIVSIFVNPTQFAPHEDFDSYPRTAEADCEKLRGRGVDAVYFPQEDEIYQDGRKSPVQPSDAAQGLETAFRPHFFEGVVNIVWRLFDHVKPDAAIFGEKDFQQLQVIRQMVEAHSLPIEIIGAPIARDTHGLALSSRNAYLSPDDLHIARQLNKILFAVRDGDMTLEDAPDALLKVGFDKIDYVDQRWGRTLAAAWLGKTRLIDNVGT